MNKLVILIFISCCSFLIQKNKKDKTIDKLFLLSLYEDDIITLNNDLDIIKYIESIDIELDLIGENVFHSLQIFKFSLGKNDIKINTSNKVEILFNSSSCKDYVVAYDFLNKISYKLKGFSKNDLLFLIRDLNKKEKKRNKHLLDELILLTDEVDFKCVYKSLKNLRFESACLKSCSEGLPAH